MHPKNANSPLRLQAFVRLLTLAYIIIYLISSHHHAASTDSLGLPNHFDKLIHFGVYLVMSCLLMGSCELRHPATLRQSKVGFSGIIKASLIVIWISFIDEFSQPWFGRHFDWIDLAFDWAGVGLGILVYQSACLTWHLFFSSTWTANNSVD